MTERTLTDIATDLKSALRNETKGVVLIGNLLIEAKDKVAHGEWLPWLKENFGGSESSAQNYMSAARYVAKTPAVTDLNIRPGLLYVLAEEDEEGETGYANLTPEDEKQVRDEIFAITKDRPVDDELYNKMCKSLHRINGRKKRKANAAERKATGGKLVSEMTDGLATPPIQDQAKQSGTSPPAETAEHKADSKAAHIRGDFRAAVMLIAGSTKNYEELLSHELTPEHITAARDFLGDMLASFGIKPKAKVANENTRTTSVAKKAKAA